jgi:hypothetical protein
VLHLLKHNSDAEYGRGVAATDAGVLVTCPSCGETVLQKSMIPVLAEGGDHKLICVTCARAQLKV